MCKTALAEGVRMVAATAHQNERYPDVTPRRIREGLPPLAQALANHGIPLTVFPSAEVMAIPDMESLWQSDALLSLADRRQYLLVEMPHQLYVDLSQTAIRLRQMGVRIVLAHPERTPSCCTIQVGSRP